MDHRNNQHYFDNIDSSINNNSGLNNQNLNVVPNQNGQTNITHQYFVPNTNNSMHQNVDNISYIHHNSDHNNFTYQNNGDINLIHQKNFIDQNGLIDRDTFNNSASITHNNNDFSRQNSHYNLLNPAGIVNNDNSLVY